jgi:ribosomal-protein-alanine N-acetyltransferase
MIETGLMTLEDVDAVSEIEKQSFAIPWSRDAFVREVTENRCARYLVVREDGVAVAYAGMWLVLDEGHVTNIAVRKDARGRGLGELVARAMMQLAADTGIIYMTLECRRSNLVAQSLYKKLGFVEVGFRKRYYADNNEDALVMACEQLPEAHPENDPYLVSE